ncbi:NCS1 nucleoside transporter family [Suillus ampliporus]|nr:NCS1 nucleoside transporter family [Suillus ampliporus]
MGLFNRIIQSLEVTHEPNLTLTEQLIANEDLLPVEPEKQTWRGYNYVSFCITGMFNVNMWMIVSSMIQLGMSWWQAWICVWLGYVLGPPFLVLNARPGAIFHVMFPIVNRTSFGTLGSLWQALAVPLRLGNSKFNARILWNEHSRLHVLLPILAHLTAGHLVPRAQGPPLLPCDANPDAHSLDHIPHMVHRKSSRNRPDHSPTFHAARIQAGWAMVVSTMSLISNQATIITKRRTLPPAHVLHRPRYPQLFAIPITCVVRVFDWHPCELVVAGNLRRSHLVTHRSLENFLNDNPSGATRFGVRYLMPEVLSVYLTRCHVFPWQVWFISTSFMLAQVTTNISANSVSAGCDLTALFPRFINIRRGGYIAATVGLAMCPWNLLKSSNEFTSYLSAYSVFLSSIAGVMVTEYYVVRKGHYNVKDLYNIGKDSWYWYTYGINFRAYAAYIAGILINVVGFAGATGRIVPLAATRIYDLSFFTGFGVSAVVYWALNRVFPVIGAADRFEEIDVSGYERKAVARYRGDGHRYEGQGIRNCERKIVECQLDDVIV